MLQFPAYLAGFCNHLDPDPFNARRLPPRQPQRPALRQRGRPVRAHQHHSRGRSFVAPDQKLTADDGDTNRADVYVRSGGVTTLISAPTGVADPDTAGVSFPAPSADGSRVFFITAQKLTADDTDSGRVDLYERSGDTTTLVSAATGVPNPDTAGVQAFAGASEDGSRVFFNTSEKLTADDGDTARHDVYERSGGTTTLVSGATGVPDPDSGDAFGAHVSLDGSRVVFLSPQKLAPDDADTARWDAYERSGGATKLVSGPTGVPDPDSADVLIGSPFGGVSEDGSRIFFTTTQKLTADDGDRTAPTSTSVPATRPSSSRPRPGSRTRTSPTSTFAAARVTAAACSSRRPRS